MVTQNETSLISYSRSLVRDLDSAREIVQDAFLKLWIEIPPPPTEQLRPWLFTVCRNAAYDRLRRSGMVRQKQQELALEAPSYSEDAGAALDGKDAAKMLAGFDQLLTPAQSEVLRLKFSDDLSYKEIAAVTGHTVNHVGVLIHQAVIRLREAVEKQAQQQAGKAGGGP